MTASIQSSLLLLRILAGFQSVLILFQLYLCIMAFRQHRTPVFTGLVTAQFLTGLAFYFVLLEGIYPLYQQGTIVPPSSVTRILGLPWFFLTLAELLSLILCLLCAGSGLRYARSHLSPGSIKRAIDLLPAGICCGEKDGTVCLANLRISELCQTITGHALTNTQRFWEQLLAEGETRNGSLLMRLKDGSVYQFERRSMTAGGVTYDQITASDVTEQYRITAALQERGAQLRDIQLRTKTYHAMAADMVISQEILNARRTVHDGVGHALLTQQYYLEPPEKIDESALLHLLRQTNTFLLREAEETDDQARDGRLSRISEALRRHRRGGPARRPGSGGGSGPVPARPGDPGVRRQHSQARLRRSADGVPFPGGRSLDRSHLQQRLSARLTHPGSRRATVPAANGGAGRRNHDNRLRRRIPTDVEPSAASFSISPLRLPDRSRSFLYKTTNFLRPNPKG